MVLLKVSVEVSLAHSLHFWTLEALPRPPSVPHCPSAKSIATSLKSHHSCHISSPGTTEGITESPPPQAEVSGLLHVALSCSTIVPRAAGFPAHPTRWWVPSRMSSCMEWCRAQIHLLSTVVPTSNAQKGKTALFYIYKKILNSIMENDWTSFWWRHVLFLLRDASCTEYQPHELGRNKLKAVTWFSTLLHWLPCRANLR